MILSVRGDSGVLARVEGRKAGAGAVAAAAVRVVDRASRGSGPCPSSCGPRRRQGGRSFVVQVKDGASPCSRGRPRVCFYRAVQCHETCEEHTAIMKVGADDVGERRATDAFWQQWTLAGALRQRADRAAKTPQTPWVVCRTVADWRTPKQSVKFE